VGLGDVAGAEHHAGRDHLQFRRVGAIGRGQRRLAGQRGTTADQRMIDRQLGREAVALHGQRQPGPGRRLAHGLDHRGGIGLGGVAVLDPHRGFRDGDVDRGAVVVDDRVEVGERRVVVGVLQRCIGAQAGGQRLHLHQELDQIPVGVAPAPRAAVRLHAGGGDDEVDVAAMAAQRTHQRRLRHHDSGRPGLAHQHRALGKLAGALLGGLLVGGDQQRYRHPLGQAAGGDDAGGQRTLHVGAAQPVQHAALQPRRPGVVRPTGVGHRVHVAGQRQAAGAAAAPRHQDAFGHAGGVGVVDPLDGEAGQRRLHRFGDGEIGDETAAIDAHQVAGEGGHESERVGHRGFSFACRRAFLMKSPIASNTSDRPVM
jgi:hypothetical protein